MTSPAGDDPAGDATAHERRLLGTCRKDWMPRADLSILAPVRIADVL